MSLRLSLRIWSGPVHTMIGASHFLSRRFDLDAMVMPKLRLRLLLKTFS